MWWEEGDEDLGVVGGARRGVLSVRCIFGHLLEQRFLHP
jgi:hypothetical protein